jgi:hypothetical protein
VLSVELIKNGATRGEPIQVGRFDVLASVESDIFPPEVVGYDMHDVWLISRPANRASKEQSVEK